MTIYQGDETHQEVCELREAAAAMAIFLEEEMGMDKPELTRLWCALKPFGWDRTKPDTWVVDYLGGDL